MVSIKHKVTLKTKTAQEETPVAVERPVVTLKRKHLDTDSAVESPVVTLKKKHPEVSPETKSDVKPTSEVIPEPSNLAPITPEPEKKFNTGQVVGGIAVAAVILAGVCLFGMNGDDNVVGDDSTPSEQIAKAGETTQPEEAQQVDAHEDAIPEKDATAINESETPAYVEVNETLSYDGNSNVSTSVSGDVVENAKRVIRGDFGNGQERKDKLGASYAEIQSKVNEMYRQGLVH